MLFCVRGERMAVFTIADLHLSFGTDKPMNVFNGWQDCEERLRKNWLETVGNDDTVVIAGDLSWGMNLPQTLEDFRFIDALPGEKLIVKGNHDYWWTTVRKMTEFFNENGITTMKFLHNNSYERGGVQLCGTRGWLYNQSTEQDKKLFARELMRLEASLASADGDAERVAFLHYPPVFSGTACSQVSDMLEKYGVKRCYFGHIHVRDNELKNGFTYGGVEYRLISSICADFKPIRVTE